MATASDFGLVKTSATLIWHLSVTHSEPLSKQASRLFCVSQVSVGEYLYFGATCCLFLSFVGAARRITKIGILVVSLASALRPEVRQ
jgi:uncharacterized membrane protein (DUF4010 family)